MPAQFCYILLHHKNTALAVENCKILNIRYKHYCCTASPFHFSFLSHGKPKMTPRTGQVGALFQLIHFIL